MADIEGRYHEVPLNGDQSLQVPSGRSFKAGLALGLVGGSFFGLVCFAAFASTPTGEADPASLLAAQTMQRAGAFGVVQPRSMYRMSSSTVQRGTDMVPQAYSQRQQSVAKQALGNFNALKPLKSIMPFDIRREAAFGGHASRPVGAAAGPVIFSLADIEANAFKPDSYKTAFMFPGQGAQAVGMGVELAEKCPKAKELYDKASEILGYDLLAMCKDGPKEKLDTTAVSQPAIFVTSMAAVEMLKMEKGDDVVNDATVAMGLSLGEYSALCFAGAISFEDGVKLVQERGAAMQAAADMVDSGMASVIGLDSTKVGELCKAAAEQSGKPVQIANYLCKGNYAVSGDSEAIAKVMEIAKPEFKARMAVKLAVAGAFHTEFMQPAVERLKGVLDTIEVKEPRIPVVSNVDGKAHKDPAVIKEVLTMQVTSPVKWEDTMTEMLAADFESAYELGPGKVLNGLLKRFSKAAEITNVGER